MKLLKRLLTTGLALCMAFAMTACSDTTWVFDVGGTKIPSGLYLAYTINAYQMIPSQADYDSTETDIMKQVIEGKKASDWIKESAKEDCIRYAALEAEYAKQGMTLSEEDKTAVDASVTNLWENYGPVFERNGVSKESYRKLLESTKRETALFTKYYDKGGVEEVKNEDLVAHFKESFASVNIFRMALFTGSDVTDEQKTSNEETVTRAAEYVRMMNEEGKTFGETYDQFYHDELGTTHDPASETDAVTNDSETRTFVKKNNDPNYSQKVIDTIFNEMKVGGDAKYIADEDNGYYYIVKRYDVSEDEQNFDDMRSAVLYDIKGEDFTKLVDGWIAAQSVTENSAAVSRYNPKNIDLKQDSAA